MTSTHQTGTGATRRVKRPALRVLAVLALAYALVLRALVLPVAASPGDPLGALLADPHPLCLTQADAGPNSGLPAPHPDHCGDCCLLHARLALDPALDVATALPWPRLAQTALRPRPAQPARGPPEEAWSPLRAQRGPPLIDLLAA
jgi:hypothetical protein